MSWEKKYPNGLHVIVVNHNYPLELRRLTLAHELAHRVIDFECLEPKSLEKAAQRFARAFLIPRKHLENEVGQAAKRFERLCYRALAEKLISLPKAAELLHYPLDDVMNGLRGHPSKKFA